MNTLLLLLMSHALADFALQSPDMAKGKNRNNKTEAPPGAVYTPCWTYWLTVHAMIHGLAVYVVTQSAALALAEIAAHWIIDFGKCENWYGIHVDQAGHVACKIAWAVLFSGMIAP